MAYNKGSGNRYDKGSGDNDSSQKSFRIIAVLIILGVLIYNYSEPILEKINSIVETIDNYEESDEDESDYVDIADIEEAPLNEYHLAEDVQIAISDVVEEEEENYNIQDHEFSVFVKYKKFGVKDLTDNKVVVEPKYDLVKPLKENSKYPYLVAKDGDYWGVINMENKELVPFNNMEILEMHDQGKVSLKLYKREKNGNYVYGFQQIPAIKSYIPAIYSSLEKLTINRYKAKNDNDKFGIITSENKTVIPFRYDDIEETQNRAFVKLRENGLSGLGRITDGMLIISPSYNLLELVSLELIIVSKNGEYACIDIHENIIVPYTNAIGYSVKGRNVTFLLKDGTRQEVN